MSNIDVNNLTDKEIRNLEVRLKRKLIKQGEILRKGKYINGSTGYIIVDSNTNGVVAGGEVNEFNLSLEDVINYAQSE